MPSVYTESEPRRRLAYVGRDLYTDFLDQVLIEEKSIETVLSSYTNPDHQRELNNYIINRLAEVDWAYVPKQVKE